MPEDGTLAVFGLGPIGQMTARIAKLFGARVIGVDSVPERLDLARAWGIEVVDTGSVDDVPQAILDLTGGRGADGTVDAVGMEAHGSPLTETAVGLVGRLPDAIAKPVTDRLAVDRLKALTDCIKAVRRGERCRSVACTGARWTRCR